MIFSGAVVPAPNTFAASGAFSIAVGSSSPGGPLLECWLFLWLPSRPQANHPNCLTLPSRKYWWRIA